MTILVQIGTKTCLPERFDSDFDLTRKTTVGSEPAQDMFVRVVFGWVLFTNAFKTASGPLEIENS